MQRALSLVFVIAALVLSAVVMVKSAPTAFTPVAARASEDAGPDAASSTLDGGRADDAGAASEAPAVPVDLGLGTGVAAGLGADGGLRLADGTMIAPLGSGAPRQVRFGVVLVTYEGTQGAPAKARSRKAALAMAETLAADAKADFKGAVQRGDNGSTDDAGIVPRGVLEPTTEAALFSLAVGATSGVIETPRGFWIVKRLE